MSGALLEIRDLRVEFRLHRQGVLRAVDGVGFRVPVGGTLALVGESGSGKSVICQAVMGILPRPARVAGGRILFRDPGPAGAAAKPPGEVDIAALDPSGRALRALRGGRISMIFQEPMTSLSPLHTVGNQIREAALLHQDLSAAAATGQAREMLERVGFPDPRKALDTYPFELSGGLRQRAMIAMALVCRPALLIADEPTTALDVTIQAQILKLLQDLKADLGMAVLLVTHDLGVVANMADEVVVVYHGRVMESGPLPELFERPRHPYLKALMRAVPRIGMAAGERLTPLREVPRPKEVPRRRGAEPPEEGEAPLLLEAAHLSKRFAHRAPGLPGAARRSSRPVLDDVSLGIARGECLGLVGESGCGKTTFSKILMRAIEPDAGTVTYHDEAGAVSLLDLGDRELVPFRRRMQYVFQDPMSALNPRMTVFDILSEPLVIHALGDREQRARRVTELMRLVGLDPRFLSRYPHSFSGGQRQRIGIARALALRPELVICDEPVSALDVSVQAQVLNLLKDLQQELGLTCLFVSHNLAVVDYMAERIAVMCAGQLVEIASREALFAEAAHPYTRALLGAVPRADPRRRLDLSALMEGKVSDPAQWPPPFRAGDGARPELLDLGGSHYVRAVPGRYP